MGASVDEFRSIIRGEHLPAPAPRLPPLLDPPPPEQMAGSIRDRFFAQEMLL